MADTLASLSAGTRSLILKLSTPTDWNNTKPRNDLSAIKVWYSTVAGFTPGDTTLAFSGPASASITIPALLDNTTYYVRYAFISSIDPTVYSYSKQYSQTTLSSSSGTNGASTYRIYIAAANSSATPTTPATTTSGATPAGWSASPVTLTGTQAQFQSDGATPAGSTTTTWGTPYLSYFKVDTLEAITTNTGSLTVTGTFKAGTATISGTGMTGAGGVLYSSGNFAFGNSSTNITYNGTTLSLNGQVVYNGNIQPLAVTGDKVASGTLTADKIDARGLSIKDTAGNVILSAGSSLATSSFGGNVTGSVDGTSASTLVTTANTANSTANTANSTANTANGTANTALSNAAIAANAAATAQSTANAKLAKSGADILTGPINLNAANALTVGTPALDSVSGHNGFYIGSTGIVGTKNGAATFTLDNNGNAVFAGSLTAASGTFVGNVTGSVDGTSASTLVTTATTASTNASNALTNAATAQSTANAKLAKSGADILTGPINLNAATAILVGTTSDGLYLGNTGIVGRKAGATTFSVDASGNAIFAGSLSAATGSFAGSLSAATGSFGGNVTGTVDGTSATTLVSTANTANTNASTAITTANTANTNATAAQNAVAGKLAKSGADTLVGPITLSTSNALLVGTINDGVYIGSTGIVGRKASQTTFAVDASGNAIFKGDLTGASGTFTGNLTVGSSPALSGTTMTGSGGVINSSGTFALGNNTTNIAYNGTALYLNGNIIATGNINANAVSGSDVYNDTSTKVSTAAVGTGYNYFTIATLYFQSYGNKVIIDSQAVCSIWSLTGTSGTQTFQVALFVDGSIVSCASEQKQINGDATVLPDGSNLSYYQDIPLPMFVFTPDSNVHTYQLKIIYSKTGGAGNYYVAAKNVSLKAVEYKR